MQQHPAVVGPELETPPHDPGRVQMKVAVAVKLEVSTTVLRGAYRNTNATVSRRIGHLRRQRVGRREKSSGPRSVSLDRRAIEWSVGSHGPTGDQPGIVPRFQVVPGIATIRTQVAPNRHSWVVQAEMSTGSGSSESSSPSIR